MIGVIPFLQALSFLMAIIGFVGFLHGFTYSLFVMMAGVLLFFMFFSLWVWHLLVEAAAPHNDKLELMKQRKLNVAIRLVLFWMFAFSTSFAMIPMYYWLHGLSGHAHGGSTGETQLHSDKPMAANAKASVYITTHTATDSLPVKIHVDTPLLELHPGTKQPVRITITNPLNKTMTYRLLARVAPDVAQPYIMYPYLHEGHVVKIPAKGKKVLQTTVSLQKHIPEALTSLAITLFLYGDMNQDSWQKMQTGWPHQSTS